MNTCYARPIGGLGNQLFIIATGFAYAKKHDMSFVIDGSNWNGRQGNHIFTYKDTIFKNFEFGTLPQYNNLQHISELRFNYDELPKPNFSVVLNGYFQSLRYFEDVKDEFISLLDLPAINTNYIEKNNVAMHIRRGDYLHIANANVCGTNYFKSQIDNFKDYQINVFTDSPDYVQQELLGYNIDIIKSENDLIDLAHMSQHDNIVCSNSTFSWWASLLGKKKQRVIVPDRWFNDSQNHSDIYREDFIRVPAL